jgi:hypothetical protein
LKNIEKLLSDLDRNIDSTQSAISLTFYSFLEKCKTPDLVLVLKRISTEAELEGQVGI